MNQNCATITGESPISNQIGARFFVPVLHSQSNIDSGTRSHSNGKLALGDWTLLGNRLLLWDFARYPPKGESKMKIHHVTHGEANLTLTAKNCAQVAAALSAAAAGDPTLAGDHLQDLASAFQGLAIATLAQYELTPQGHACHLADLADVGLTDLTGFPRTLRPRPVRSQEIQ